MNQATGSTPVQHEVAIFPSRRAAESAVHALLAAGFPASDVSLFVHAPINGETPDAPASHADDAIEIGGETGAGIGAAAGGLEGMLAGFGVLAVPGVGPVLAIGPLAAALTGAITGGALGGVAGALAGEGVSEAQAIAAERHMKEGRAVVILECADRCDEASAILRAAGAVPAIVGASASDPKENDA